MRADSIKWLEGIGIGMSIDISTPAGMFVWADTGCDTNVLAEKAMNEGILLAPGCLFSPSQLPSRRMRLNVATLSDPEVRTFLTREIGRSRWQDFQ